VLEGRKANVFLGVNQYEGIVYFNKEKFERLLEAFFALSALETVRKENLSEKTLAPIFSLLKTYSELATAVGYKYNDLLSKLTEALKPKEEPTDTQLTPSKPKSTTSVTAKKAKAKEVETELHFSDEMKKGMAESLTTVEKGKATAKKAKAKETVVEASSKTVVKSKTEKPTITRLSNKSGTKITSSKTAQTKTTSAKTTTKKTQTKQVAKKGETIKRITTAKATTSKTPTKKK
jgi:hypothetical protein